MKPRLHLFLAALCTLLIALPLIAQDQPEDPSGMDPVTTPAPLPTREPRPAVFLTASDDRAQVQQFFIGPLPQGETRLFRVVGDDITAVTATWQGGLVDFWPADDGAFYGLLSVHMEADTGIATPLSVTASYDDGTRTTLSADMQIVLGSFIAQNVTLPPAKGYLLDPALERSELARLESLIARVTPERFWDETGFQLPIANALTSPFGAFRTFNAALSTRHTGWDIRTTLGVSVMAMAAGRVAYVGTLPIRGDYVLIDHGYGVYSGYAHCSDTFVEYDDPIAKGQTICVTGNTGRTSGPHFHWETAVNGVWVDAVQLLELWMP